MPGKPVATVGSMHVCPMVNGTVPHVGGPVSGPGVPTVLIDGQPAAVVGDMCMCCGPPDSIVQGAMGVLIDGKPLALMGSMTAHAGQITVGIPTVTVGPADPPSPPQSIASIQANELLEIGDVTYTEAEIAPTELEEAEPAMFTGCIENPLLEQREEGIEENEEITVETTILLDELKEFADKTEEQYFISDLKKVYGSGITWATYAEFYQQLKNGGIEPVPIEVVKNFVPGYASYDPPLPLNSVVQEPEKPKILGIFPRKQPEQKKGQNKIFVSEDIVRKSQNDKRIHEQLMDRLADEFSRYISYLLQHEIKAEENTETSNREKNEVKKYF